MQNRERERERERDLGWKVIEEKKKCIKFNMKDTYNDMTQYLALHKDIQNR